MNLGNLWALMHLYQLENIQRLDQILRQIQMHLLVVIVTLGTMSLLDPMYRYDHTIIETMSLFFKCGYWLRWLWI